MAKFTCVKKSKNNGKNGLLNGTGCKLPLVFFSFKMERGAKFVFLNMLIFKKILKYTLRFTENGEVDIQLDVLFMALFVLFLSKYFATS